MSIFDKVRRNLELAKTIFGIERGVLLGQELVEKLRELEGRYAHLLSVPEPSYVTHGTDVKTLDKVLRDGALLPEMGGAVPIHFSMNTTEWPEDCYIVFPFEKVKVFLKPVFYVPSFEEGPLFTEEYNDFGVASWDVIDLTEVFSYSRIPLEWALGVYIPSGKDAEIKRMVMGRLPVISKPETALSRWATDVERFKIEAIKMVWDHGKRYFPAGYIPKFAVNYNLMLERIFNMPGGYQKALEEFKILRSARYVYY
jgi:hypothetical protein